jgi:hypothetical protein
VSRIPAFAASRLGGLMPQVPRHAQAEHRQKVTWCLHQVNEARDSLHAGRHERVDRWEEQRLRALFLLALERYAAAVAVTGTPLSLRLRTELELYRAIGTG